MGKQAAAAPQIPGVCATFFVGTPQNDAQLGLARQWAQAIVSAVADDARAQLRTLVSPRALLDQMILLEHTVSTNAPATAPSPLGGLDQPTLVLLTRALRSDGSGPQTVLFYGVDDAGDALAITKDHLDHVQLQQVEDPLSRMAVVADDPNNSDLVAVARTLDFMRRSAYTALYLCSVGDGRAVDAVAQLLAPLIDMVVYFNRAALVLTVDPSGALQPPQVGVASVAQGSQYQGTTAVALQASDAQTFLPGSEGRVLP